MKVLISCEAPLGHTGYSTQSALIAKTLQVLGHDVDYYAWPNLEGGSFRANNITFYPNIGRKGSNAHYIAEASGADVLLTLHDIWQLPNDFTELLNIPWIAYFPIDGEPLMDAITYQASRAEYPVVYSEFGARVAEEAGLRDVWYIPHMVDVATFQPLVDTFKDNPRRDQRDQLRAQYGFDPDAFVVSMVATNIGYPSRKAFPEAFQAFAQFAFHVPNAVLYVHTNIHPMQSGGGYPLEVMAHKFGIARSALRHVHQVNYGLGLPADYLADIYRLSDVLLSPSMGEGFGLPIVEAQLCGTPVITQACSAMTENTVNGIAIPRGQPFHRVSLDVHYLPKVADIIDALMLIHKRSEEESEDEARVGVHFMRAIFTPSVIKHQWAGLLDAVAAEREAERIGVRISPNGPGAKITVRRPPGTAIVEEAAQ